MNYDDVKIWVVCHAKVSNPYKRYFSASVTINRFDINGIGDTIEKAYGNLADRIYGNTDHLLWLTKKYNNWLLNTLTPSPDNQKQ